MHHHSQNCPTLLLSPPWSKSLFCTHCAFFGTYIQYLYQVRMFMLVAVNGRSVQKTDRGNPDFVRRALSFSLLHHWTCQEQKDSRFHSQSISTNPILLSVCHLVMKIHYFRYPMQTDVQQTPWFGWVNRVYGRTPLQNLHHKIKKRNCWAVSCAAG